MSTPRLHPDVDPSAFLQLAGHPLRWRLLGELARSDRIVQELTDLVGEPQNLVSYHLAKLRDARLVSARRSSADRRDTYYALDIERMGALLSATGGALHPGLRLSPPSRDDFRIGPAGVLFLCTGNSARSQMAEALVRDRTRGAIKAVSAGSHPRPIHPSAVRVMRDGYGLDLSGQESKHLDLFAGQDFDWVISLCDRVREVCPDFPGHPEVIHWSIPNPVTGDADDITYPLFQQTAAELSTRIDYLLALLSNRTTLPGAKENPMPDLNEMVSVRYMVDDVAEAVAFYTKFLDFEVLNAFPPFADLARGRLRLLISGPMSSAGRPMADGAKPGPGGWNRIHLIVDDLEVEIARLREAGAPFRNDMIEGPGGKQVLLQDPSGNVVELFQPAAFGPGR